MRRITLCLLWLFVFSVPWGLANSGVGLGTISRSLGMVTVGAGVLNTLVEGRIRRPGAIFWFALVFAISSGLSLFWTITYADTSARVGTYFQFVALIWIMREFARTRERQESLRLAYCLGALVFAFDLLHNFIIGAQVQPTETRFSASGINPNFVGYTLVIGFPMAWNLFVHHRGTKRIIASVYCLVAPVAVVLTAGRGSVIAGLAALSIIPLTLRRESLRHALQVVVVLFVVASTIAFLVPRGSWDRLLTIKDEVEGGSMSGRTTIWDAGRLFFQERPLLGVGAGGFPAAVEAVLDRPRGAHNLLLALLVEQGIVGVSLFACLLGACAWVIIGLPAADRKLWAVVMVAWLILGLSSDTHFDKVTWVLFGLLAAQQTAKTTRERSLESPVLGGLRMGREIHGRAPAVNSRITSVPVGR